MSNEKDKEMYEIGQKIRERRIALNLSQDDLARRMDIDRNIISRHENGSREMRISSFCDYAEALSVSPSELLPDRVRRKPVGEFADLMETAAGLSDSDLELLLAMAKRMKNGCGA